MNIFSLFAILAFAPIFTSANEINKNIFVKMIPMGTWGGDHARVTVRPNKMEIELDCAQASIPLRPKVDARGNFHAEGTYTFLHGGPIRIGEQPDVHPAHFNGHLRGNVLSLNIAVRRGQEDLLLHFYPLWLGSTGNVFLCL